MPTFPKDLIYFWKFSTTSGTATWEQRKQNLAACSSCELKVIHSLKWISMRSLRRVIRHQEDFILRTVYWLMWQQAILAFAMCTSRSIEAAGAWRAPRLKTGAPLIGAVDFCFHYKSCKHRCLCSGSINLERSDLLLCLCSGAQDLYVSGGFWNMSVIRNKHLSFSQEKVKYVVFSTWFASIFIFNHSPFHSLQQKCFEPLLYVRLWAMQGGNSRVKPCTLPTNELTS